MYRRLIGGDTSTSFRRGLPKDANDLVNLFNAVYRHSSHPFQNATAVSTFLADSSNFQIIAETEDGMVATAAMAYSAWNDSYELGRALTHPSYRGHGLAAAILQTVVDWVGKASPGQIVFGFPRVRRIAEICSKLNPRMAIVGHDAGRNVADGAREVHLIIVGVLWKVPLLHVAPFPDATVWPEFVQERIYQPLGLEPVCGKYPETP